MTEETPLDIREITEDSEFLDIKAAWNELLRNRPRSTVFLTHEWCDAAWQWLRIDHELKVLTCHNAGQMVAIAPFCARTVKTPVFAYRQIKLMEVPDSQECDFLAGPDAAASSVSSIIGYLIGARDWDVAVLTKLEPDSDVVKHGASAFSKKQVRFLRAECGANLEVDLSGAWDSYYATRSRRLKKGNNSIRNRILAGGEEVSVLSSKELENAGRQSVDLLSQSKQVSSLSWKNETGLTLDQAGPGAFIDRLSEHAIQQRWLSIWALMINDRTVATEYQLQFEGVVVALRADFDSEYSKLSPGSYLNWQILEGLFETDNTSYRMGPGDNPYKLRWSNRETPLCEYRLYNRTIKGSSLFLLDSLILPAYRRVRKLLGFESDLNSLPTSQPGS